MYIAAQKIVEKMEEELSHIAAHAEREEKSAVQDHARVLKAYCDLLLEEKESKEESQAMQTRKGSTSSQHVSPPISSQHNSVDVPATTGNLLEF